MDKYRRKPVILLVLNLRYKFYYAKRYTERINSASFEKIEKTLHILACSDNFDINEVHTETTSRKVKQ